MVRAGAGERWRVIRQWGVLLLLCALAPLLIRPAGTTAAETARPELLVVPALGIWASVQAFALNDDRSMPVPQEAGLVAWYSYSAAAGTPGNSVLAGHRDWQRQRGVFYDLDRLATDDDVWLRDAAGAWHRYRVTWTASIEDDAAPVEAITGPTVDSVLTLITCSGAFDRAGGRYLERRVVRAVLELSLPPNDDGA